MCYVQELVNDTKKDNDTIIHKDNGKSLPSKYFREKVYAPALEAAGIPYRVPHCTRHTLAILLDRANVPGSIMQKLLGHTKYEFTVDTYIHKNISELQEVIGEI